MVRELSNHQELLANLKANCVPASIMNMGIEDYSAFLIERRKLMA